jgi:hypothetical protein
LFKFLTVAAVDQMEIAGTRRFQDDRHALCRPLAVARRQRAFDYRWNGCRWALFARWCRLRLLRLCRPRIGAASARRACRYLRARPAFSLFQRGLPRLKFN